MSQSLWLANTSVEIPDIICFKSSILKVQNIWLPSSQRYLSHPGMAICPPPLAGASTTANYATRWCFSFMYSQELCSQVSLTFVKLEIQLYCFMVCFLYSSHISVTDVLMSFLKKILDFTTANDPWWGTLVQLNLVLSISILWVAGTSKGLLSSLGLRIGSNSIAQTIYL